MKYISRNIIEFVKTNLSVFPAVAILGSRQCGEGQRMTDFIENLYNF